MQYFLHKKTHVCSFFSFFISCNFIFLPIECPGLCRHRPGHSQGKNVKLHEMFITEERFWKELVYLYILFSTFSLQKVYFLVGMSLRGLYKLFVLLEKDEKLILMKMRNIKVSFEAPIIYLLHWRQISPSRYKRRFCI